MKIIKKQKNKILLLGRDIYLTNSLFFRQLLNTGANDHNLIQMSDIIRKCETIGTSTN